MFTKISNFTGQYRAYGRGKPSVLPVLGMVGPARLSTRSVIDMIGYRPARARSLLNKKDKTLETTRYGIKPQQDKTDSIIKGKEIS